MFSIRRVGSAIPRCPETGPRWSSQPAGCLWHCHLWGSAGFSSVFSARRSGVVGRSLMLFKIEVIVALPVEQRGEWQRSWQHSRHARIIFSQNILPAPTGSTGHSRGLHHSQHSARLHPHCRYSTTGALLPQPGAQEAKGLEKERDGGSRVQVEQQARWQAGCGRCGDEASVSPSHLGLCAAGLGPGSGSWFHRDV